MVLWTTASRVVSQVPPMGLVVGISPDRTRQRVGSMQGSIAAPRLRMLLSGTREAMASPARPTSRCDAFPECSLANRNAALPLRGERAQSSRPLQFPYWRHRPHGAAFARPLVSIIEPVSGNNERMISAFFIRANCFACRIASRKCGRAGAMRAKSIQGRPSAPGTRADSASARH